MFRSSSKHTTRHLSFYGMVCFTVIGMLLLPMQVYARIADALWLSVAPPPATSGPACEMHGAPPSAKKSAQKGKSGGRPQKAQRFESEHRPTPVREYFISAAALSPQAEAYVLHPDGSSDQLEIQYGLQPSVTLKTPMKDDRFHGANNIYVIDKQVHDGVLVIQSAKWLSIHHSCGWGHDYRNDKTRKTAHALDTIPLEVVINGLWDGNFHTDLHAGDEIDLLVTSEGAPVTGALLTVSTEKQWSLSAVTGGDGIATIQLIKDYYPRGWNTFKRSQQSQFTVTAKFTKNELGQYNGQPYRQVHYIATFPWKYSPAEADYKSYAFGLGLVTFALAGSGIGVYSYRERRKNHIKALSLASLRATINAANLSRFRWYFQLAAFGLLMYGGYLAINIGDQLPTFACIFTEKRGGSCYLMGFQHQMATPFDKMFTGRGIGILVGLATFVGFFILFNKAWCGFACPLGTLQDWFTGLRRRFSIRYSTYSEKTFNQLSTVKYFLLALLILIPMGMGNSFFGLPKLNHDFAIPFCMICPGRTVLPLFNGDISQLTIDFSSKTKMIFTALGLVITGLFFTGAFVKKRFFCLFCPMSALHYIFSKASLFRLTKNGAKCTRCGNCYRACDVGIRAIADDLTSKNIVKDDCMMCLKCVEVCPEEGCLEAAFLGVPIYQSTQEGFFKRRGQKDGK